MVANSVASISAGIVIAEMIFLFSLAMLAMAFAFYHLVRGVAALGQLKAQVQEQQNEQAAMRRRPEPRLQTDVPDFGTDDDLRAAVVAARRTGAGNGASNGEADATTFSENADVDDERTPPISQAPFYK